MTEGQEVTIRGSLEWTVISAVRCDARFALENVKVGCHRSAHPDELPHMGWALVRDGGHALITWTGKGEPWRA